MARKYATSPDGATLKPKAARGGNPMITFVRTDFIAPGKQAEALAFAHQIAKLVEKTHRPQGRRQHPGRGKPVPGRMGS